MRLFSGSRKNRVRRRQWQIGRPPQNGRTLGNQFRMTRIDRWRWHDVAVEGARFFHLVTQQDGIVEAPDLTQAHGDARSSRPTGARSICTPIVRFTPPVFRRGPPIAKVTVSGPLHDGLRPGERDVRAEALDRGEVRATHQSRCRRSWPSAPPFAASLDLSHTAANGA